VQKRTKITRKKKLDSGKSGFKKYTTILLVILISISIWAFFFIQYLSRELPSLEQLERYEPKLVSKIYADNGELIREITGSENRELVPFEKFPKHLVNALVAYED